MNKFLVPSAIATLVVSLVPLFGAEVPIHSGKTSNNQVDPSKTPKGLSDSDLSGIRGVYERNRHAIVANPDGTYQARNPGQA